MATYYQLFSRLVKVSSNFLNRLQVGVFTQRANGAVQTLSTGLDTPSASVSAGHLFVSLGATILTPPAFGVEIDTTRDYRDRWLTVALDFDPAVDIRPGHAGDAVTPTERNLVAVYTGVGGAAITISSNLSIYVDTTNGYLWIGKTAGYVRGRIDFTCQLKERS